MTARSEPFMGHTSIGAADNHHAGPPAGMPQCISWLARLYLPGLRRGRGHDGCMTHDLPPRATDIFRHLADLRSGTYEGARQWPERVEVFRRAVSLLADALSRSR